MDNNNPSPIQSGPTPTIQPNPQPAPVQTPPTDSSSNKIVLWLVIGLVVIVLVVGGIYVLLSRQQAANLQKQASSSGTPVPQVQENLEDELNAVDVGSPDQGFSSIDQDLQQL